MNMNYFINRMQIGGEVIGNLLMTILLGEKRTLRKTVLKKIPFHVSLLVGNGLNKFQVETIQVINYYF